MTSIKIQDDTGSFYCNLFEKEGNEIFNITADEIRGYKDNG